MSHARQTGTSVIASRGRWWAQGARDVADAAVETDELLEALQRFASTR